MPKEKPKTNETMFITLEENNILRIKNDNLIQRVRNTGVYIEEAEIEVKESDKKIRELNDWLSYIACDHIPNAYETNFVRRFLSKVLFYEEEDILNTMNWQLGVDERSILTQDFEAVNVTAKHIKMTQVDFGTQYDKRVNDAMTILSRVVKFLEEPCITVSPRIYKDILELKFAAYKEVNNYIDNLTYRVLCSEDAYMVPVDVTTAEYAYKANNFSIHIWTFVNVPLYLDPHDTPYKELYLKSINVKLTVPFSVLCRNMVIRGLHCHFDHFSAHARYFELPMTDYVNLSLKTVLKKEWEMQMKLQNDIKLFLTRQRAEFEESMRLKAEEEELKAKQKKNEDNKAAKASDKPAKQKKPPKEPPIVPPGMVPLIRQEFINQDYMNYQEELLKYHPDSFELYKGEVNLRKFQILGGVYQLNSLSKPKVTQFSRLIMSWYSVNERIQYKVTDSIFEKDKPPPNDILKFFQITFELPEIFCYWGEPVPCLFEAGTAFNDSAAEHIDVEDQLKVSTPVIINDFNLHELFNKERMYNFIETSIPRIISSFKFPDDLRDEDEEKKAKAKLGRTKISAAEQERQRRLAMEKLYLSYKHQFSPERLFPLFKRVVPVIVLPLDGEFCKKRYLHPYEHFSEFLSSLEAIKDSYRATTFKNKQGKEVQILAEKYDKNIRQPKITKLTLEESKDEKPQWVGPNKTSVTSIISGGGGGDILQKAPSKLDIVDQSKEGKGKKGKRKRLSDKPEVKEEVVKEEDSEHPWFSKWSTSNILKSEYDAAKRTVTIWTDRLGTFGFAYYRYQHFPYQNWSVQASEENPNDVEVMIASMYAVFRFNISPQGYTVAVTDFTKYYKSRKIYFEITEPEPDLEVVKQKLQQNFLNVFPERDAAWYITGYFCEKHAAAEFHTYNCMSLYATALKFGCSFWNKLSNRRTMVFKYGEPRDLEDDMFILRATPEDVTFVEIKEVCTDLEVVELEYTPTWRNLEWYPDLNYLITSNFNNANELRIRSPQIVYYVKNVLQATRPLSCS